MTKCFLLNKESLDFEIFLWEQQLPQKKRLWKRVDLKKNGSHGFFSLKNRVGSKNPHGFCLDDKSFTKKGVCFEICFIETPILKEREFWGRIDFKRFHGFFLLKKKDLDLKIPLFLFWW